jgi:hypothetical protein
MREINGRANDANAKNSSIEFALTVPLGAQAAVGFDRKGGCSDKRFHLRLAP